MSNSILDQVSKEYEIFLFFNSEKKKIVIFIDTLYTDTDTILRYFISNTEIKKPSYVIKINQDGVLK